VSRGNAFPKTLFSPRQTLFLWIGERRVQWGLLVGRGSRSTWRELGEAGIPDTAGTPALSALCAVLQEQLPRELPQDCAHGLELRVIVADAWLFAVPIPWNPAMSRKRSALAFARDYLSRLGFAVAPDDEIRLDDAPYGASRLAVAYPSELLQAIRQCALRWHVYWRLLRPVSVLAWNALGRKRRVEAMAILNENDVILCLAGARRWTGQTHLQDIRTQPHVPNSPVAEALPLAWKRLCLRRPQTLEIQEALALDASGTLKTQAARADWPPPFIPPDDPSWRCLRPDAHWLRACRGAQALDGHALPPRRHWRHWLLLGMAMLVAGGIVFETWRQFVDAQASRSAYEASRQTHRKLPPVPWSREEQTRIGAVNAAIRQLNLPIEAVLHALRPPRDIRVAVLQVETASAATGDVANTLKITAEAPSSAEMTRYVAYVSDRRPFTRAYLTHHELLDEGNPERFRFTMEAQWND
jgi:hypothetical protein